MKMENFRRNLFLNLSLYKHIFLCYLLKQIFFSHFFLRKSVFLFSWTVLSFTYNFADDTKLVRNVALKIQNQEYLDAIFVRKAVCSGACMD